MSSEQFHRFVIGWVILVVLQTSSICIQIITHDKREAPELKARINDVTQEMEVYLGSTYSAALKTVKLIRVITTDGLKAKKIQDDKKIKSKKEK